jgi:hypothetical protein
MLYYYICILLFCLKLNKETIYIIILNTKLSILYFISLCCYILLKMHYKSINKLFFKIDEKLTFVEMYSII